MRKVLATVSVNKTKEKILKLSEKTITKKEEAFSFFTKISDVVLFLTVVFKETFSRDFEFKEFLKQCYQIGYKTLPLISITGTIMGLVLTIQSRPVLIKFGAETMLPSMVAVSIIREMGPVITALICAGKIGSGIGAELGSMKVTEQIDAMEVSSTNPVRFLIVTRVLATTLMVPILVLYADALGIIGSWIGANIKGDVSFVLFFAQAFKPVEFIDLFPAIIKTFFFGAAIGLVGCYKGFNAGRGTESVGKAANSAVVLASLLVIIIDMVAVQITDMFIS
ncbi:MlaE family ABC transporter permease [Flavobacterium lacus]|jgi:phospholipid/cholesterol/gamma-HCH transport system permease protein|uniref:Phospholipid/cholesterol/gamma-HCH transport system permease protein n=1 Tax=Flavobacterium lacus TaxID=1353778 RepID=A0A328WT60_9FLAO|nr:ABC transporter permease [Flavobacterium lacus]RAR46568.1 phospholipid/cholesterol/gamma-HCH transport system permease protein [Flavobacterium lacus]